MFDQQHHDAVIRGNFVKAAAYRVNAQLDAYVRQLRFLARAEYPSDTLERMMAVVRLMLCCMTDLLRPSSVYRDTPHVLLGAHNLTERELGATIQRDARVRLLFYLLYDAFPISMILHWDRPPMLYMLHGYCHHFHCYVYYIVYH